MRFRVIASSLLVASAMPQGVLHAQTHIAGMIGGASVSGLAMKSGLGDPFLPDVGFTSMIELNRWFSIGAEARYVRKDIQAGGVTDLLQLAYVETPLFVRIGDSPQNGSQAFARVGAAPAVEVHCGLPRRMTVQNGSGSPNHPESGPAIGMSDTQETQPDLEDELACLNTRQRTLDFGWLAGIGASFRSNRSEFALELRATVGVRNLSAVPGKSVKNRTVTLLVSSGTRWF